MSAGNGDYNKTNRLQILRAAADKDDVKEKHVRGAAARGIIVNDDVSARDKNDATCVTFVMHDEDHTLGNALRYVIMKNPEVQFCGYTVPHPLENKIHFRIQTYGVPAQVVLRKGLVDLKTICEHVMVTFQIATTAAKAKC